MLVSREVATMTTLFLSYRRSDTAGEVGRLSDSLKQKLGKRLVFRDVTDIPPGASFEAVLEDRLDTAKLVLVLIGPAWLEELDRRLEQPDTDYLRVEVATALSKDKRVIPVLLKGAMLPLKEALPNDLVALSGRQTMTLRDESWESDVDRLIDTIGRPYSWAWLAARALFAVTAIIVGLWILVPQFATDPVSDYVFLRRLVVSLVSAYGLIELFVGYLHFRSEN